MAVIIKDFQVVTEKPASQAEASPSTEMGEHKPVAPPSPKTMTKILHYIKRRRTRIHAD